ncbi:methyl-accepting chemotaxis protein [Colwellia sp. MB02u-18]|uniref:methyl-accepting chemotaxis protein n=1 Tax=unclassified Colwellia TaxID=196834 RepID=UPI0015F5DB02|nr:MULTISPECIES: methyl-accepting chemotaxis protein [unclassified Colwellia]MBA6225474.1 methyl-accepting chemotaxis protein [Colwellia sp. MB3u-45]MBA6266367.1 methyl-accepting chemotaxis protein [Colwellia sp. MB3u-43]MBA6320655.1 methyl-accepting chemotaxis protein [Colwellia sp. MB02u-19]MBA6325477.1 methyl-accepting chemotaxis protein [Colwellia sp. MB02u-18]MBA6331952.1 methyl-accepting chemotaxis protein [Colwellia sp. MB02u-12]
MTFSDISFKNKIFIVLALPLIGFLWLSILTIKQSYIVNNEMKNLTELTQLSISYSELVHELQKERGTTAGFLGSKGKTFVTRLNKQRIATDEKLTSRDDFLKLNDFKQVSIVKLNQEIAAELEKLNLIRSQVSDLAIDSSKAIAYYTRLNAKLLSVSYIITDLSTNAKLTEQSIAYYNFLQGKERAGIERAVLSSTFARDEFSEGTFVKFVTLETEQKVFMANFLAFTSAENIRYYQEQMAHPAIKEVMKLRTIAESKTSGFGVDPLYWFQQATLKIGQYQKSGQKIADNLLLFVKNAQATAFNTLALSIAVTIVLLMLVIVITRVSIKDLTSRVNELTQVMRLVRNESDLTVRTKLQGKSELGQISIALNLTLEQFSNTINEISSASLTLSAAAEETSVTCEHNAITLAEQQEGIVAIATAVEELSATVKEVAGNTQATADSAREADSQAKSGLDVVQLSYHSIEELSQEIDRLAQRINSLHASSGNITKVVDVIKSVADQTNLLALNAAIEAARAGEQGRGFAVVADEVRTLAKRTHQSTLEIESFIGSLQADVNAAHQVIENSQQKASVAVENSKNVEHSLQEITSTISHIFAMTEQVATAIEEQSVVTQDVAQNIINIELKSSETSAGATQIATTAKEQAYLATRMQDLANRFHI